MIILKNMSAIIVRICFDNDLMFKQLKIALKSESDYLSLSYLNKRFLMLEK